MYTPAQIYSAGRELNKLLGRYSNLYVAVHDVSDTQTFVSIFVAVSISYGEEVYIEPITRHVAAIMGYELQGDPQRCMRMVIEGASEDVVEKVCRQLYVAMFEDDGKSSFGINLLY